VHWVWYWAILDREGDGRIVASIPDFGNLAAHGVNEKDAVAHVAKRAGEHVRALEESGQPVPRPRQASEMPTTLQSQNRPGHDFCAGRATSGKAGLTGLVPSIEARCDYPSEGASGRLSVGRWLGVRSVLDAVSVSAPRIQPLGVSHRHD
jgi:predicted RNase H-like HicB family nuclease